MAFVFQFFGLVARAASSTLQESYSDWNSIPGGEHVHKLTSNTVEAFIKAYPSVFLFFYSPHCGHCSGMKPDLAKAATLLNDKSKTAKIAALNAEVYDPIYHITGVPTMFFFRHGHFVGEYRHHRRAKEILAYILAADQEKM